MADHPRQEIEFSFGGKTYRVRPTWEIIVVIEAELNQASRVVGMKLLRGEASVAEMIVVVWNMIKGQKGAPETRSAIGEIIMEDGYGALLLPLGNFLTRAQRGNKEHEKEAAGKAPVDPPGQPIARIG